MLMAGQVVAAVAELAAKRAAAAKVADFIVAVD